MPRSRASGCAVWHAWAASPRLRPAKPAPAGPALRPADRSPLPPAAASARHGTPDMPANAPERTISWHQPSSGTFRADLQGFADGEASGDPPGGARGRGRRDGRPRGGDLALAGGEDRARRAAAGQGEGARRRLRDAEGAAEGVVGDRGRAAQAPARHVHRQGAADDPEGVARLGRSRLRRPLPAPEQARARRRRDRHGDQADRARLVADRQRQAGLHRSRLREPRARRLVERAQDRDEACALGRASPTPRPCCRHTRSTATAWSRSA